VEAGNEDEVGGRGWSDVVGQYFVALSLTSFTRHCLINVLMLWKCFVYFCFLFGFDTYSRLINAYTTSVLACLCLAVTFEGGSNIATIHQIGHDNAYE